MRQEAAPLVAQRSRRLGIRGSSRTKTMIAGSRCNATPSSVHPSSRHSGGLSAGIHRTEPDACLKTAGMTRVEMETLYPDLWGCPWRSCSTASRNLDFVQNQALVAHRTRVVELDKEKVLTKGHEHVLRVHRRRVVEPLQAAGLLTTAETADSSPAHRVFRENR